MHWKMAKQKADHCQTVTSLISSFNYHSHFFISCYLLAPGFLSSSSFLLQPPVNDRSVLQLTTFTFPSGRVETSQMESNEDNQPDDRLSNLPDDLITNILSRLPTTDAVATSVLSKIWIRKWTCVYNVDLNDLKVNTEDDKSTFLNSLRKTLRTIKNPRAIHLKLWMTSWKWIPSEREPITLSDCTVDFLLNGRLLSTGSLRNLNFKLLTWTVPTENHFPNLVSLKLRSVRIFNESSNNISCTFTLPAAKEIYLQDCRWSVTQVEIHAPVLKTFISSIDERYIHHHYTINIHGAKLEKFCSYDVLENLVLTESTVVSAALTSSVDVRDPGSSFECTRMRVVILLEKISSSVEDLTLSFFMAKVFLHATHRPRSIFQKLRRLAVCSDGYHIVGGRTEDLFELLDATPFLKSLVIKLEEWSFYDYDAGSLVPSCIKSNLEEVEFYVCKSHFSYHHVPEGIDLAKFMLETGAQLKRFQYVMCGGVPREDDIMEKLSSFSRASTDVVISVQIQEYDESKKFLFPVDLLGPCMLE